MSDVLKKRFGERCRAVRLQRGLSQMDMVRHHEWSLSHWQKIERGVLDLRLQTMAKAARSLGLQLSQLLDGV
jgi:transcriptional regulator with XRE-family HTH domain